AENMATYIGYPNELLEEWKVAEIYDGLHLNSTSYFENVRILRKWATDYVLSKLRKSNVKGDWKKRSAAAVVNAFYNSIENSIEFPAGILQGAFFDKDRPNLNHGGGENLKLFGNGIRVGSQGPVVEIVVLIHPAPTQLVG
ncbi:Neprilysin-2, partial [Araneus ventricosus]